ncbi:hypothetical protein FJ692_19300 [Pseudomonas fluorescens]|nr:hypothetical protein FJ692_19300 [Pseudomonas fluorescens]
MLLWRGSLLPLGCEAPKILAGATHPSGSKLPRHIQPLSPRTSTNSLIRCQTNFLKFKQLRNCLQLNTVCAYSQLRNALWQSPLPQHLQRLTPISAWLSACKKSSIRPTRRKPRRR